nr:MAG TPA: abiotic ATP-binding protein [Caudoviricetes sp.]
MNSNATNCKTCFHNSRIFSLKSLSTCSLRRASAPGNCPPCTGMI